VAFLVFSVVAAVTPGPSNLLLITAGARVGVVRGLPCLFGVAGGMGVMMFVVPLGLGSLILDYPAALVTLHWGGAAFLLWLSWKIATSSTRIEDAHGSPVGYWRAAVFQWVNPKSWLVSVSAAATFLDASAGHPVAQAASLGALFVVAAWPSGFVWLAFGATLQRVLDRPRRLRAFNLAMGVLLALSIALVVR